MVGRFNLNFTPYQAMGYSMVLQVQGPSWLRAVNSGLRAECWGERFEFCEAILGGHESRDLRKTLTLLIWSARRLLQYLAEATERAFTKRTLGRSPNVEVIRIVAASLQRLC